MADSEEKPNKPGDSDFKQQRLKYWRCQPNYLATGIIYLVIGCVFIIIGSVILYESSTVVETTKRYDDIDRCKPDGGDGTVCTLDLHVEDDMDSPVFVYYEIHNMYQNHYRYAKSRDINQLMGDDQSKDDIESSCDPIIDMGDLGFDKSDRAYGKDLSDGKAANPCGLMARSLFNDTYILQKKSGDGYFEIKDDDIAWEIDKDEKFSRVDDWKRKSWTDVEDKHFIVWMTPAGLPTFRKLYGKIDDDIDEGHYQLTISANYDVSDFDGKIYFVLSTTSSLGGKNDFLGILYIVIAGISLVLSVLMLVIYFYKKRAGLSQSQIQNKMDEKILSKYINSATVKAYLQESALAGLHGEQMADKVELQDKSSPSEKQKTTPRLSSQKSTPAVSYVRLFSEFGRESPVKSYSKLRANRYSQRASTQKSQTPNRQSTGRLSTPVSKTRSITPTYSTQPQETYEQKYYRLVDKHRLNTKINQSLINKMQLELKQYQKLVNDRQSKFEAQKYLVTTNRNKVADQISQLEHQLQTKDEIMHEKRAVYEAEMQSLISEIELLRGVPKVNIDIINDVSELKSRLEATEALNRKITARYGIK